MTNTERFGKPEPSLGAARSKTPSMRSGRTRSARGPVLALAGPPGIGKSALLHCATERAVGFLVVRVKGVETEMAFGYAGINQLLLPSPRAFDASPTPSASRRLPRHHLTAADVLDERA
jgi:hypothetical protein